jgi:glutamine amidotransferase
MCRLYALHANEPTKVECTLVHAQNALMRQSQGDSAGYRHSHGWGIAAYEDHRPQIERQAWAAYHGEHFKRAASRIFAHTVLAHVRRATMGEPHLANTHPFSEGAWTFIHNGTVPAFRQIQERVRQAIAPHHRAKIGGTTDSEHIFRLFLTLVGQGASGDIAAALGRALQSIAEWSRSVEPEGRPGLNVIVTDGDRLVATRWGRGLYYLQRRAVYDCEICGFPHIRHRAGAQYRAVVLASEPITHEHWTEVPERSILRTSPDFGLSLEPF